MLTHTRCCALACLLAWAAAIHAADATDLRPKVDAWAKPLLADRIAVGFVVGIVRDGRTEVIAYGETARGSGVAPDGDTVYEIGSISKVFTGVLLAGMVERGEVKLDDTVQQHLPESVKLPVAGGQPMTLLNLATHTSGLPRMPDNFSPADPANPYADYSVPRMYAFLSGHTLRRPPGEFEYSNLGMGLLGQLLARRAAAPYERLMIDRIAAPLGMDDTRITLTEDMRRRLAPPYNAALGPEHNWDIPTLAGAGAIRSTCNDMLRFVRANLARDDQPLTGVLAVAREKRHAMKDGLAVGLAWHIARDGITWWHNGMTGGYAGWVSVVPSRNLGVVVLANTATMSVSALGEQVTRIAFGLDAPPPKPAPVVEVAPAVLAGYAGVYQITPQFALTVTVEDGGLMVQATNQSKLPVFAESATRFVYRVVEANITFTADKEGKISGLVLRQAGQELKASRVK